MNQTTAEKWHTTHFVSNKLQQYLKEQGFRLSDPEDHLHQLNNAFVATKLLSKELIQVRGTFNNATEVSEELEKNDYGFWDVIRFFVEILLSPINFFNSMNGYEGSRCLCLPDTDQYRMVMERLGDYFAFNNLHLKIYLVDRDGNVKIVYLNPTKKERVTETNDAKTV